MGCDNPQKPTSNTRKTPTKERMHVAIETGYGTMVVELFNETPLHRDNFIQLVKNGSENMSFTLFRYKATKSVKE